VVTSLLDVTAVEFLAGVTGVDLMVVVTGADPLSTAPVVDTTVGLYDGTVYSVLINPLEGVEAVPPLLEGLELQLEAVLLDNPLSCTASEPRLSAFTDLSELGLFATGLELGWLWSTGVR